MLKKIQKKARYFIGFKISLLRRGGTRQPLRKTTLVTLPILNSYSWASAQVPFIKAKETEEITDLVLA